MSSALRMAETILFSFGFFGSARGKLSGVKVRFELLACGGVAGREVAVTGVKVFFELLACGGVAG